MEVKVFIDVFKLCTFSTDQIKELVGEVHLCIVGRDMDNGKKKNNNSHREIENKTKNEQMKNKTTGYQNLRNKKREDL